jgi:hypothetical protein
MGLKGTGEGKEPDPSQWEEMERKLAIIRGTLVCHLPVTGFLSLLPLLVSHKHFPSNMPT